MILLGLAGKSCTGKNEVAKILQDYGWVTLDADSISRALFNKHEEEIFSLFSDDAKMRGLNLKNKDGHINKKVFSNLLFSNPSFLNKMEAFILPKIDAEIEHKISSIKDDAKKICLNAPTLHKSIFFERVSYILYIRSSLCARLVRAIRRDGFSIFNICKRFLAQRDFDSQYLKRKSDILSINNGSNLRKLRTCLENALLSVGLF